MQFKVMGKSLIPTDFSHKITRGENMFDDVKIILPRHHDGIDNSLLNYRFTEVSEDGTKSAVQILTIENVTAQNVILSGEITSAFSAISGTVFFMLIAINGDNIVGKFPSIAFTVNDDLTLTSLPNETAAEQLFNRTQLEVQKAIDAADRAEKASQTPAPAEVYPATTEKLGGVKVDGKTITASADGTISAADSENVKAEIAELKSIIGFTDNDIIGLHADFENNIFMRLGSAIGKNPGSDFDVFTMYGGRKRCNVLDDGTITAYYGDSNFAEDGSNGQVMVYQPKFYYKVIPLKLDPQTAGYGHHLRSANYYISDVPKSGFKLHPAFYGENGNPVDYILFSAYEGSVFDVSENTYLLNDEQITDFAADKLSSIANVKPCSGQSQNLTRANIERLAQNRGNGWHCDTVKAESANQFLMIIEYASFNMQSAIGLGAVSLPYTPNANCSLNTGKTSALGNMTGNAGESSGKSSISYRGMENPWGNIWNLVQGINEYMDSNGIFHGFICDDYNFSDKKSTGNYKNIGYTLSCKDGFISAFGYSPEYDWLFIPSENNGTNQSPVGDTYWCNSANRSTWRSFPLGGGSLGHLNSGAFYLSLDYTFSYYGCSIGGRLMYIPISLVPTYN